VESWRKVVAALANDKLRIVFAELVLEDARRRGLSVQEGKRRRALEQLVSAGIVREGAGGELNPGIFRALLQEAAVERRRDGVERFLVNGRIDRYPANRSQRHELLAWIAGQAFNPGESLPEKAVNERLMEFSDDHVLLRRYLVDAGLLERTPSGSSYSPVPTGADPPSPQF
jgi:hypothetical protein